MPGRFPPLRQPDIEEEKKLVQMEVHARKRATINCVLFAAGCVSTGCIVPVLVDDGCDSKPLVVDLDPMQYLHKSFANKDQSVSLRRWTRKVTRFPFDNGVNFSHAYTVFYSRKNDHFRDLPINYPLKLGSNLDREVEVLGNVLVCKSANDWDHHLLDMAESEIKLVETIVIMLAKTGQLDQTADA